MAFDYPHKSQLPELKGAENWLDWSSAIKRYLKQEGLWKYVNEEIQPEAAEILENLKLIEKEKHKTSETLFSNLHPFLQMYNSRDDDPKELWDKLNKMYEHVRITAMIENYDTLSFMRLSHFDTVTEHCASFQMTRNRLEEVNFIEDDLSTGLRFLKGLEGAYSTFHETTILNYLQTKTIPGLPHLVSQLNAHIQAQNLVSGDATSVVENTGP